ncbi:MAG: RecQ family ATP-dependent DNA helicase [Actinomycetota bacterium]|nr:RecQ family ATP-dependent DNA helicase [Actinomycetota bacterium]
MNDFDGEALDLLQQLTGKPDATFRDGQLEAIHTVVRDRGRALVVQRTGWGKSAVYLIATSMLRSQGSGPTIIVSPLLALMRNQLTMADALGINAQTVNSSNRDDWEPIFDAIDAGEVDLLLISPERLNNPKFRAEVMPALLRTIGLLVIDEVHCISDWGHDFRPDYRRLEQLVGDLDRDVPILGTTATANDRVVDDVTTQLGHDLQIFRGTLERDSLALQVLNMPDRAERMAWLAQQIPLLHGSGIVYCLTIADAERVGVWLRSQGIEAATYTGPTPVDERLVIERRLSAGDLKVVVATSALAMGYDNPHIEFVIHYQTPGSPIAYYQQVGRAGRAVDRAFGIAMIGGEDRDIQDWFIDQAFPTPEATSEVLDTLGAANGTSRLDLERTVNIRRGRIESMLKILEVEGAVSREGSKWFRSDSPWEYPADRIDRITAHRRIEQVAMATYATTEGCLMELLRGELDDPGAAPCGRCANCVGGLLPTDVDPALVQMALEQVRQSRITIEPRIQLPCGLSAEMSLKEHNIEPGRSLTRWGDPGWAQMVKDGLAGDQAFSEELVDAMVAMLRAWRFDERPTWITSVPSTSHPHLTSDFARRVAARLEVPCIDAIRRVSARPPQKTRENGCQQARNVLGAFEIGRIRPGPVLLIDDTVDSKWTLTMIGHQLREAGSGPVFPIALVDTSGTGG